MLVSSFSSFFSSILRALVIYQKFACPSATYPPLFTLLFPTPPEKTAVLEEMPPYSETTISKLQRLEEEKQTVTDTSTGALAARRRNKATSQLQVRSDG